MKVSEVRALAARWVERTAPSIAGFRGAHLMGGALALPPEAPFPAYRDVDLNVVVDDPALAPATYDLACDGLILEYSTVNVARYRSAEAVLADPELAANLAAGGILADPAGLLAPLQAAVAAEYGRPRWVRARCEHELAVVGRALGGLRAAATPGEALWAITSLALFLAGALAEATLRPPTHRRCLAVLRQALHAAGRRDLHEATLQLLGWAHLTRAEVEAHLAECAAAFDLAAAVTRTPVPFREKLQPHVRPYVVEGARELIAEGSHREAMFWIAGFTLFAGAAIEADAPEAERGRARAALGRLTAEMGLATPEGVAARAREAEALAGAVRGVVDALARRVPGGEVAA